MLDPVVTRAVLCDELPVLRARAARAGWEIDVDPEHLILSVRLVQRQTGMLFALRGMLTDYKALPPAWEFIDPETGEEGVATAYPKQPARTPGGGSQVFIAGGRRGRVICLPCNRLAYGEHGGPHSNWALASWMDLEPRCMTLCEMVNRINVELQAGEGSWATRGVRA